MNGPPVIKYVSCERYDGIHELYKLSSGANGTLTCFNLYFEAIESNFV